MNHRVSVPKVSVIMPVYKPEFMALAIDSILAQTMRDFELILVNDGSPYPQIAEIANDYARRDARIIYIEQENQGVAVARNTGVAAATSPYLMLMDDDDVSLPTRMLKQYEFLLNNPEVAAVDCARYSIDNAGNIENAGKIKEKRTIIQNEPTSIVSRKVILQCDGVPKKMRKKPFFLLLTASTVMMKKKAFVAIGGQRSFFKICEDRDFYRRLEEQYPIARMPDVLYHYRANHTPQQLTKHKNILFYVHAAETATYFRRQGQRDPINDNTTLDDMIRLFPQTSPAVRHAFIRQWMTGIRKSLHLGGYEQIKKDIIFYRNLLIEDEAAINKAMRQIAIRAFLRGHWKAFFYLYSD